MARFYPDCSENQNWVIVEKSLNSSGFKVEIKRSAIATEKIDRTYSLIKTNVIYSYTDREIMEEHSGRGSGYGTKIVDFATGEVTNDGLRWGDGTYMTHQHTQLLLWTVVVDIFIPVGRYLRRYNRFFDGHSWPLLAVLVLSLIFRDVKKTDGSLESFKDAHEAMATILIFLSAMIILNGIVLRVVIEFDKFPLIVNRIGLLRMIHLFLGFVSWVIARGIVITGARMHAEQYSNLVLILVVIETILFVLVMIVFEGFNIRGRRKTPIEKECEGLKEKTKPTQEQLSIIQDLQAGLSTEELKKKYPGKNIALFKNKIYDFSGYIHPGGQFLLQECRFREISRFMEGAVGLERLNGRQWHHSNQAYAAMNRYYIGDLIDTFEKKLDIVLRNTEGSPFLSETSTKWYMSARKKISPTTAILQFKSKQVKVKLTCKGTEWLGRHYTISDDVKSRPYTNCTSLAMESSIYRKSMMEYFQVLETKGKPTTTPTLPEFIDYLPICVKEYQGKRPLSKKLVSGDQNLEYRIDGPIGRGIEIPNDFSGHVLLIAGGTGILPFLDFLEFLLKKSIYEVCKRDGLNSSFILPQQDYSVYYPKAKFSLLAAFRSPEDFVGMDIVTNLFDISQKKNLTLFDALVKVKGLSADKGLPTTDKHFNADLLKQYVGQEGHHLVLICGTPVMQAELHKDLTSLKVPNDKIVFV